MPRTITIIILMIKITLIVMVIIRIIVNIIINELVNCNDNNDNCKMPKCSSADG